MANKKMRIKCIGEYHGFTVGEFYEATIGVDSIFEYECYVVQDDDGDVRSIDFESEDFVEDRYL